MSDKDTSMNASAKPEAPDDLLKRYQETVSDESFEPASRVRSAVLMYARTLAEHRNAFPGSVAHRNEDEEQELASVPREQKSLDPRPLPIKPLPDLSDEGDSWPRELPRVAAANPWLSLGRWVATAIAGGLALGAGYSWWNGMRHQNAGSNEPILAQAPATLPAKAEAPASPPPATVNAPTQVAQADIKAITPSEASRKLEAPPASPANKSGVAAASDKAAKPTAVAAAPRSKERNLPAGSTSNPSVMVADGAAIPSPQIAARSLSTPSAEAAPSVAAAPAAPVAQSAVIAAAPAMRAAAPRAEAAPESRASAKTAAVATEYESDPAKWMNYINALRTRGRTREADVELMRLRERYPQYVVPAKPAGAASAPAQ